MAAEKPREIISGFTNRCNLEQSVDEEPRKALGVTEIGSNSAPGL
jgi:hypothetical protein